MHPWKVHALKVFDQWTGALVNRPIEPLKRGVIPHCTRGRSTRWRCSTGGLLHMWTNLQSFKNKESFPIYIFFHQKNIGASICISREIWCLPYVGFLNFRNPRQVQYIYRGSIRFGNYVLCFCVVYKVCSVLYNQRV